MVTISDPGISESGNRTGVMSGHILAKFICFDMLTKGTETSKYLQEKKTKVISSVAASEMETA